MLIIVSRFVITSESPIISSNRYNLDIHIDMYVSLCVCMCLYAYIVIICVYVDKIIELWSCEFRVLCKCGDWIEFDVVYMCILHICCDFGDYLVAFDYEGMDLG